jgi:hypothetical protein
MTFVREIQMHAGLTINRKEDMSENKVVHSIELNEGTVIAIVFVAFFAMVTILGVYGK